MVPSPGQTKIKGAPKMVPLNGLAYDALFGKTPRIGGRFFINGKTVIPSSIPGCERVKGRGSRSALPRSSAHHHDLATQCSVDYAVIQALKGEPLPGSAKYYIYNWNARLRDAITRLEAFTKAVLSGENDVQVPLQCHISI